MNEFWIPIVTGSLFIIVTGAVILLRPISKRLGEFLEVMIQEKRDDRRLDRDEEAHEALERLERRLDLVEERLDFTEKLLTSGREEAKQEEQIGSGG